MARAYVGENREDGGLTIFTVGMIAASISMMAIVIFACAKSSTKRKNKLYSDGIGGDDGNRTFAKTFVTGESNKAQKPRATSAPVRSTGEIVLVSAVETATTVGDIPSTNDVCNNNNNDNDGGKDTRCHGGDSNDRIDNNNNNTGASHDHTHHVTTNGTTSGEYGHHHDNTSGNTGGGGGWSSDHGGSSWSGGDHSGGGFSGGGDTGAFSSGGW